MLNFLFILMFDININLYLINANNFFMHILFYLKTSFKNFNFMLTMDIYFQNSYFLSRHIMLLHTFTKFIIHVLFFFNKTTLMYFYYLFCHVFFFWSFFQYFYMF